MTRILIFTDESSVTLTEQSIPAEQIVADINTGPTNPTVISLKLPGYPAGWSAFQMGALVAITLAGGLTDALLPGVRPLPSLTDREKRIMQSLAVGRNQKTIASELHLNLRTVRRSIEVMRFKVGAQTTEQLIALCVAIGLCGPPPKNHPE